MSSNPEQFHQKQNFEQNSESNHQNLSHLSQQGWGRDAQVHFGTSSSNAKDFLPDFSIDFHDKPSTAASNESHAATTGGEASPLGAMARGNNTEAEPKSQAQAANGESATANAHTEVFEAPTTSANQNALPGNESAVGSAAVQAAAASSDSQTAGGANPSLDQSLINFFSAQDQIAASNPSDDRLFAQQDRILAQLLGDGNSSQPQPTLPESPPGFWGAQPAPVVPGENPSGPATPVESPPTAPSTPGDSTPTSTAPSTPGDSTPTSTAPSTPGDSTPTSTAPSTPGDSTPTSTAPSTPGDSTPTSTAPSTPGDSSTTPGPNSVIGPTGDVVGSTASTFGSSAMPEVTPSGNVVQLAAGANLQNAINSNAAGTTFELAAGTYDLSSGLNLTSANSGDSFINASGGQVVLDGGGTSGSIATINGANNITMEGLTFQNTQKNLFAYSSDDAAVTATNSSGDNFSYNNVSNVGVGFNLGDVTNSQLNGNAINDVQQAIQMNPGNNNDTISSNSITNVENVTGGNQSGAINVEASSNDTFGNNYFQNISASAIELVNWGGVSPNNDTITGNTVLNADSAATKSNSYDSSGTNPSDMGAIYAWQGVGNASDNMNLKISNNYINGAGQGYENVGIYLDDGVSGASVTNNVDVPDGNNGYAALVHGGSNDTFQGNVFDLTSSSGDQHGLLMQSDGPQMQNDSVTGNYFYANGANGGAYVDYSQPSDNIPQNISGNDYYGVSQSNDSSPVTTNPGFTDPSDGNYTLGST